MSLFGELRRRKVFRVAAAYAYNIYGDALRDMGDLERMIEVHRKAVELDPLSVFMRTRLAAKLVEVGKYEESRALLDEALSEYPDNWLSGWFLEQDAVFAAWREDPEFLALVAAVEAHSASERARLAGLEIWP